MRNGKTVRGKKPGPIRDNTIRVKNLGPIRDAEVTLRDLTVLVGPQASGKSIFLQTLKILLDRGHIFATLRENGTVIEDHPWAFMHCYYGRGLSEMLEDSPTAIWRGERHEMSDFVDYGRPKPGMIESLFYIPAQRVTSLDGGATRTFGSFRFGDPYVLRHFANRVHTMLHNELGFQRQIFPALNRLNKTLREPISAHLFRGAKLMHETVDFRMELTLRVDDSKEGISYLAWSAGQREFVPLLLGLYWLCPAGSVSRRDAIEWVVIEEPEMGLHPRAISAFLLMVLELMRRGYKVIISTHSTSTLDLIWVIRRIIECGGGEGDVRDLFEIRSNPISKKIAEASLEKKYAVYFFDGGDATDISSLDPGDENDAISEWGGLTGFSSRSADVVTKVVNRRFFRDSK